MTNTTFNSYKIKLTTINNYSDSYHFIREKKKSIKELLAQPPQLISKNQASPQIQPSHRKDYETENVVETKITLMKRSCFRWSCWWRRTLWRRISYGCRGHGERGERSPWQGEGSSSLQGKFREGRYRRRWWRSWRMGRTVWQPRRAIGKRWSGLQQWKGLRG